MAIRRRWDVQVATNYWLSLGFHFDHTDPSLTLHLPGVIVCLGNCKQPGFRTPEGAGGVLREIAAATEALIWVTGHEDFGDGGKYREGWLRVGQPALDKCVALVVPQGEIEALTAPATPQEDGA